MNREHTYVGHVCIVSVHIIYQI